MAVVDVDEPARHAADLLAQPHLDLLVVCEGNSKTGIVTIVTCITRSLGFGLEDPVNTIMTRHVVHCRATDALVEVWRTMQERGF